MAPRTVLITGSTDGIGRQTALELAGLGANVIVHGRDPERLKAAAGFIAESAPDSRVDTICADLASFGAIRDMAARLRDRYGRIDVLINNAGVFEKYRQPTVDGFERTVAVNHLAPYLLTGLLLDKLLGSPDGRIVNVSSMVHAQSLDLEVFTGEKPYDGFEAYSQSKLCVILFTYALADRLKATAVTVNCLHPGVINTKLLRQNWHGGSPVTDGAKTTVYLAVSPDVRNESGRYFVNRKAVRSARATYDPEMQQKLWKISEAWTGYEYRI
ncbi:MAG: SDR family oxidoreductase [Desulfobacterales bacterium]